MSPDGDQRSVVLQHSTEAGEPLGEKAGAGEMKPKSGVPPVSPGLTLPPRKLGIPTGTDPRGDGETEYGDLTPDNVLNKCFMTKPR